MISICRGGILAIVALAALACRPAPARAQQTNPEVQFYVMGGKYPRGLADFQAFGLFRKEAGGKVKLDGWVMTNLEDPDNSTVDMKTVHVTGRQLTFTTKSRKGLVFTFTGRFLRSGDFKPFFHKQVPVIEGTVTKRRGGRKVAEAKMRFTCGSGG